MRIFATKAALTKQMLEAGSPRSRFGPADSWVINKKRAAIPAVGN
jgi:hypothetical protein